MKIGYSITKSPLGKVLVAATERGVSAVYLGDAEKAMVAELREEYPRAEIVPATDSFQRWVREIVQRIEGKQPRVELPLDLQATAFQRRVWQELQRIPRGRTRTYSQVARSLGQPNGLSVNPTRCGPLRELAPRTRCPLWCRAIGSFAKMESLPAIAGDFRARNNCWRRSAPPLSSKFGFFKM